MPALQAHVPVNPPYIDGLRAAVHCMCNLFLWQTAFRNLPSAPMMHNSPSLCHLVALDTDVCFLFYFATAAAARGASTQHAT